MTCEGENSPDAQHAWNKTTLELYLPEIWDAAGRADPSSGHHHHPIVLFLSDPLGNVLQGLLLLSSTATTGEKPSSPLRSSVRTQ